ncbi:uncharacterized protein LOC124269654 [Haliotis rubra]|uniref:uncharacterized protein LOC124269654 n=1 Tax=Haliotis rubra TaxID=36100 RepID=UPI001EE5CA52|nr:uncharacterized protein LOC124269654 [Haliotis rubra]
MNTWVKAVLVSTLILNVTVGIVVACLLVTRLNNEQQVNEGSVSSQNFKKTIDQIYTELLATVHGKPEDKTNDVGAMNTSSQMANLLKPIAFYTGLNNTGLMKEDHLRVTPARGWAAKTMVAPERQVLVQRDAE